MSKHVRFCGAIQGRVVIRPGETEEQALARAEDTINNLLAKGAARLGEDGKSGPVVGLEVNE